jgi:hypothetical protein
METLVEWTVPRGGASEGGGGDAAVWCFPALRVAHRKLSPAEKHCSSESSWFFMTW